MARTIRASPKRRKMFFDTQKGGQPLNLILSVATRWNSVWLMLVRFRKLKKAVQTYIDVHGKADNLKSFSRAEWRHIDYLIEVLRPFYIYTTEISRIKNSPTIHLVIQVYNGLIVHLSRYILRLTAKDTPWKQEFYGALCASKAKLMEYWRKMINNGTDVYGLAMLLDPQAKLEAFSETSQDLLTERHVSDYCFDYCIIGLI